MRKIFKNPSVIFLAFFLFILQNALGQQDKDSLLNAAVINVYDHPDHAIEIGKELLIEYKSNPEKQINVLLLMSNAYASKRDYEKSLDYALQTKEINKSLNNKLLQLQILNKIAAQYHQLGVNDQALQVLDEADLIVKTYPKQDSMHFVMGNNFALRGFIYRDQLSCEIAIDYLNKAYESFLKVPQNVRSWANRSVTSYNKGNCFISLNQLDSAKISFFDAKSLAEKAKANSLQAFSLKGLAEVYTLEGRYKEALEELQVANVLAENVGDLVLNRGIYKGMADNYLALKDWNNYAVYDEKFETSRQQTKINERKTINNLLLNYSSEIDAKETETQWKMGVGILIVSVLFLFVLGFIIWGEISFQRTLKQLKSQIIF